MNKSRIEWCDYTINPVKGLCPVDCDYCYDRRMYKRLKLSPEIKYNATIMLRDIPDKPSRIFVGSTMELFGDWIRPEWLHDIFINIREYERIGEGHTFVFLTKRPENLIKWSPFPDNCWVGVSATNWLQFFDALGILAMVKARVKFISFEPLLGPIRFDMLQKMLFSRVINWIIIGQQTPVRQSTMPKIEWIVEIVAEADKARIPVFLKNNLEHRFFHQYLIPHKCLIPHEWQDNVYAKLLRTPNGKLRQEKPF